MIRTRKRFGQHFLEAAWQAKVVDACAPAASDAFLEIGPGTGAITLPLSARVAHLLAVELDRDLAAALTARAVPNLQVVSGDFLTTDWAATIAAWTRPDRSAAVRVVGNLPYNVSSPILFRLLDIASNDPRLTDATLMLQAEVADRLLAHPGTGDYGVLALLTALGAETRAKLAVPPGAFRPVPKVRSTLIQLRFRPTLFPVRDRAAVVRLVRTAFTQRRKTIANALRALGTGDGVDASAALRAADIDPRRRPETLQLVEFVALADAWGALAGPTPVL